jgi:DNA-binding SARP family transcriptional activator
VSCNLEINIFGTPEVFYENQKVKFATRKALAILVYLVVETGMHSREKLQAIFWPESETHLAQSALRNTIVRIKAGFQGLNEPFQIEGNLLGFNPDCVSVLDLYLVRQAEAEIRLSQFTPSTLFLLQKAVRAMRGPFLEAFSLPDAPAFDDWIMDQRTAWSQNLNLIHDRLSSHQLETHLIHQAIETVNHWLIQDPLNESAYCRLVRLHFLDGNRSEALHAYETCRSLLAQELGIDPSPELKEILAYVQSTPPPFSNSLTQARPSFQFPFLGRSNEFKILVQAFQQVKDGNSQIVILSGTSGMGKTRLADEFLNWAGTEGADILRGYASKTSGHLPYQPIINALRERLERENAPEDLLDDVWLTELTLILPELRERYPDLPSTSCDESAAMSRLFESIARLGQALAARKPIVFLIDDTQWADESTLELLQYLAHSWHASCSPILLVILVRSEALNVGSVLHNWMKSLRHDLHLTRLTLTPIEASDILDLVQSLAGENIAKIAEFAAWLTAETNGQPLFVVETLAALEDCGALVWVNGDLDPIATLAHLHSMESPMLVSILQEVILSRLEWLSQPASDMLAASAVINSSCSFLRLCQVSGIDEMSGLEALDELLSSSLIQELEDNGPSYTISHTQIREVIQTQLSRARQEVFLQRYNTATEIEIVNL